MLTMFFAAAIAGAGSAPAATTPASSGHVIHVDQYSQQGKNFEVISDNEIIIEGQTYTSWEAAHQSGYFHQGTTKCGINSELVQAFADLEQVAGGNDCSYNQTNIMPEYEPVVARYRIPVVVHVIQRTNGTGAIDDARVQSQIDILNEDFQAMAGTNGAPGNDAQIEFYLATQDPSGNPTTGITRSTNNTWFGDGGGYYNSLAWDTDRYLNIYTNDGGGALGYVPDLPQGGIAGNTQDRVVILYSTFGRNAPYAPFNLGRTVTHEVGHYLGLYHTFDNGCGSSSCYNSGDRICDTNGESSPTYGCPGSRSSCGGSAPFHNYMDYSDDNCMNQFTSEQNNRMRCSLINYRPELYELAESNPCNVADFELPYGELDFLDINTFLTGFLGGNLASDINGDDQLDFLDISGFLGAYSTGCP